ncbi:hypothetical protein [Mucilaginibacter sp. UYCu711]|uniref:hypothetical protein n=1 Tax=Mucilaginibacter sp. UYCu711 TaxID=3156339 RepID=UPI003D1E4816
MTRKKLWIKPIIEQLTDIWIYIGCFVALFAVGYYAQLIKYYPTNFHLGQWDASLYEDIAFNGYYHDPINRRTTIAFFPGFPYLWRLLHLSKLQISAFNFTLYFTSFIWLSKTFSFQKIHRLLFLSVPSTIFYFLPYSESLFFLSSTIILIALKKHNYKLFLIGLAASSWVRSVGIVFLPALILIYLMSQNTNKAIGKKQLIGGIIVIVLNTFLVFYFQYVETNEWFVFFEAQSFFGRNFSFPKFPLTTIEGTSILWLDGFALLLSNYAIIVLCILIIKKIKNKLFAVDNSFILSIAYLSIIGFIGIFYGGVTRLNNGTSLWSLNRFIFSTPFFMVFISQIPKDIIKKSSNFAFFALIFTLFELGLYKKNVQHTYYYQTLVYFMISSIYYIITYYVALEKKIFFLKTIFFINILISIYLFDRFLSGLWVA